MAAEQSTLVSADIALTLQRAIFNSPNYSKIVTDAAGALVAMDNRSPARTGIDHDPGTGGEPAGRPA
jgi:hypothetical protein